jgi:hypothetical protein
MSSVSNGLYFLTLPQVSVNSRYLYIKRNVEKVWGARYLSKNTVIENGASCWFVLYGCVSLYVILEMLVLLLYIRTLLCGCWLYKQSLESGIVFLVGPSLFSISSCVKVVPHTGRYTNRD